MPQKVNYPSLEAFYSENENRRRSTEADYGVWWINDRGWGHCRVSYLQATGEVYATGYWRAGRSIAAGAGGWTGSERGYGRGDDHCYRQAQRARVPGMPFS